ncbi:hypothetical protein HYH03_002657 [Edaphochlamys debaryana]|uniref:Uncharacterized protein n=1 Tax=Edaphochlamys debaryana TaxID=47281 RepID=A0A836C587_9CHLO|nr:hypothetical protein HYH03_002657 [Edaphochlamys debaryana]|eukprot:KAG2499723.1 hypothetical protein HYH03_002657 [Edaphochlamys debaryana]
MLDGVYGNVFGGTAFASYCAFWMGWFLAERDSADVAALPQARVGQTIWCGLWGTLTLGFLVVAVRKSACLTAVFASLVVTFALLGAGVWDSRCERAAGYIGFSCGSSAIYVAFATLYQHELRLRGSHSTPVKVPAIFEVG